MSSQPKTLLTPEEYLEKERKAEHRSEYLAGEMFAMAGASYRHGLIIGNISRELGVQLKERTCGVFTSDLRVRVTPTGLYTYPDIVIVCEPVQFVDDQKDTVLNPVVLIEVLSDSTKDYDRGQKFQHYRTLPSLTEYLTVAQDTPHVEHWTRQGEDRGVLAESNDLSQTIQLPSIGCTLPLSEIYRKVDWSSQS